MFKETAGTESVVQHDFSVGALLFPDDIYFLYWYLLRAVVVFPEVLVCANNIQYAQTVDNFQLTDFGVCYSIIKAVSFPNGKCTEGGAKTTQLFTEMLQQNKQFIDRPIQSVSRGFVTCLTFLVIQ